MRFITVLMAAWVLVITGCGGDGDGVAAERAGTTTQEPSPTSEPAADVARQVAQAIEAKVVFDGETCSYQGPVVVPDGSQVSFEFEATAKPDDVAMVIGGVDEGTTWDQVLDWEANQAGSVAPSFADETNYRIQFGPGSLEMTLEQADYAVLCVTAPQDTDTAYPAALIEVMSGEIEAKVVFDGETCSYQGPVVVPDGSEVSFEFEANVEEPDEVALLVGGLDEGTTWDQVIDWASTQPASEVPGFADGMNFRLQFGPGSVDLTLRQVDYSVNCVTSPEGTDTAYPAALIEVNES